MLTYTPLATDLSELRLLRILPRVDGDSESQRLEFVFETVALRTARKFVYMTLDMDQEGEPAETVLIDETARDLPASLCLAIRTAEESGWSSMWVEQLCVDQQDVRDRDLHILLRPEILRATACLICPLGHSGGSLSVLIEACGISELEAQGSEEVKEDRLIDTQKLTSFFETPHWHRIELYQEFALASKIRITDGREWLDWGSVGMLLRGLESIVVEEEMEIPAELRRVLCIAGRRGCKMVAGGSAMCTDALKARDPRDRLFRLFGVCMDTAGLVRNPSYTTPVEIVFRDFTRAFINDFGLSALGFFPHLKQITSDGAPELPSWVPDYDNIPQNLSATASRLEALESYVKRKSEPGSLWWTGSHSDEEILESPNVLTVEALVIGSVDGITSSDPVSPWTPQPLVPSTTWRNTYYSSAASGSEEAAVISTLLGAIIESPVYVDAVTGSEIGNPLAFQISRKCLAHLFAPDSLSDYALYDADPDDIPRIPRITSWLESNASFCLRGQPLSQWVKADFDLHMSAPDFHYEPGSPEPDHFAEFVQAAFPFFERGDRLIATTNGDIGWLEGCDSRPNVQQWDKVCWIKGAENCFLIREVKDGHILVGLVHMVADFSSAGKKYSHGNELSVFDETFMHHRGYWFESMDLI